MKKEVVAGLVILAIFALAIAAYFVFFNKTICKDRECFSKAIADCKRASYILETEETIKFYTVLGKTKEDCKIDVLLLQMKKGDARLEGFNGKSMTCFISKNTLVMPDDDLRSCHGELKEAIQEEVIQRMHSQIIENLGKINETISKVI